MRKCLLIQTKDGRRFFIKEKYLNQLKEMVKVFKLKICKTSTEEEILELDQLIEQFCENTIPDRSK